MGSELKIAAITLVIAAQAFAHDTWVQSNAAIVRTGNSVQVDLMQGNHGNEHRDFKLAGKADLASSTLVLIGPDGAQRDLKPSLTDQGLGEKEGFWSARAMLATPGLYMLAHTSDKVVSYAPKRSIKSAKTFVLASDSLDRLPTAAPGYDRALGHPLELVLQSNPALMMSPGSAMRVKLLFQSKPLADACVSFIPRGATLKEGFDDRYERKTDSAGLVSFEFRDAGCYLIVAHHETAAPGDAGQGYDSIKYSATITVSVPDLCACCE